MAVKRSAQENIVLTAERLFAEKGIDAVSLRQINTAAGLKNNAATHYHFGGKAGLIRAVVEYRAEGINERRQQLLDRLDEFPEKDPLKGLVQALVLPMAEHLGSHPQGSSYFRFVIQAVDNSFGGAREQIMHWHGDHYDQIRRRLRNLLADLPEEIFMQRFGMMLTLVVNSIAVWERDIPTDSAPDAGLTFASKTSAFADNLVDATCGLLTAPCS
jgi:AcrR family transcriptional regulator